jgi:hypothetical protein
MFIRNHDSKVRRARKRQPGQDLGQDCQKRTAGTGLPRKDSQNRAAIK